MGGALSSPVDDHTQREIEDLIKAILATFTIAYTKATVVGLVRAEKKAFHKVPSPFRLVKRPRDYVDNTPKKTGWLTKQGGNVKNMKRRFFVVKSNWNVDYYEKEEDVQKGAKPKGEMRLTGYTVNDDPNNGLLVRAKRLAEQMGVDFSELPKPKEWPAETIEIHHSRRRTWYVVCESMEDKEAWVSQFKSCCRNAYGLSNQEAVHKFAFTEAMRETRWSLGRWGYYSWGGSESDVLTDLIADELDYAIMGRIYSKISGPWVIASRQFWLKLMRAIVMPPFKKLVVPACKELIDPLADLIPDLLKEIINPHKTFEQVMNAIIDSSILTVIGE